MLAHSSMLGALPKVEQENASQIALGSLSRHPDMSRPVLKTDLDELEAALNSYNTAVRASKELESDTKRSDLEITVVALTPLFLALVLAISITKVTGEIKLGP